MASVLMCFAPDGARVREGNFESIDDAWSRAHDMGSRWYFYPIRVVASDNKELSKIQDVPHGMCKEWIGYSLKKLSQALKMHEQLACDYLNGLAPFYILPYEL